MRRNCDKTTARRYGRPHAYYSGVDQGIIRPGYGVHPLVRREAGGFPEGEGFGGEGAYCHLALAAFSRAISYHPILPS